MQDADDFLTDAVYLWSAEWLANARPHHDIIVRFLKDKLQGNILDVGDRNPLTVRLEKECNLKIDNTVGDLDSGFWEVMNEDFMYDTIICSHVIEHLMNPLRFLMELKFHLNQGGVIYLVAPIKPYWITPARCHFHEMDCFRFKKLIDKSGLQIKAWEEYSVPIKWKFGLRNWLRRFYKEYSIVTLC